MIRFFIHAAIVAAGLWLSSKVIPGVSFDSLTTLAIAAVLVAIANAVVRPILVVLTFPLTILTLGLFLIVVNAAMIGLVAVLMKGFVIQGFVPMVLCWVVVTLVSWVASWVMSPRG